LSPKLLTARQAAFDALLKTALKENSHTDDELRRLAAPLESRDAGLAEEIVFGVLRHQAQLDHLIRQLARGVLDAEVRIALRMGVYQLRYLDRVPPHAAVTESVDLVKRAQKGSASGLVNAVLRRVTRDEVEWPDRATALSCPEWLLTRWTRQFGAEAAEGIAKAALERPREYRRGERIMDIGAQSIVPLLELRPEDRVLDLCAAPGNKTLQMLEVTPLVTACDAEWRRLRQVPVAQRVVVDAREPLPFGRVFDKVLVDAPCSGTGTLGRNPEIKWRLKPADLPRQQQRQKQILASALRVLKPAGRLIYATCSLEQEENEDVVKAFAAKQTLYRLPGRDEGDGFFAAVFSSALS
jgi:16S rRNA (cytosine967-C5)-methyltransferase